MFNKYMNTIVYANMLPFILLCAFFVLVCYNPVFNKRQSFLFKFITGITLFMIIDVSIDYLASLTPTYEASIIRTITTFINFALSPIIPVLLYRISNTGSVSKWFYALFSINFLLCCLSIPTGIIFSVDSINNYSRGSLFFVPFMVSVLYMILLVIRSKYNYLRSQFSEKVLLIFTILLLATGMAAEVILRFRFFVWTSVAISLPLYYLLLNINHAILDPLTSAYNRLKYTKDVEVMDNKQSCVIAFIDINNFKLTNDQFGHDVGDQHLITLVKILNQHLSSFAIIYRIGGDEFVVIAKHTQSLVNVEQDLIIAKQDLLLNHIDVSYGIDVYQPNQPIADFLKHVDSLMYENKKRDKNKEGN